MKRKNNLVDRIGQDFVKWLDKSDSSSYVYKLKAVIGLVTMSLIAIFFGLLNLCFWFGLVFIPFWIVKILFW